MTVMSMQTSDIAGSLQRAPLVQRVHSAQQDVERAAAKQTAADIEKLARAAEEEVATSAPTAGKRVRERDGGQASNYVPQRRPQRKSQPQEPDRPRPSPPGEGTIIDIDA